MEVNIGILSVQDNFFFFCLIADFHRFARYDVFRWLHSYIQGKLYDLCM